MTKLFDPRQGKITEATWDGFVILASDLAGRFPSFGGYVDQGERGTYRGNVFSQILSNVFGSAR